MKHKPTPPANREAALRYQAERLLQDAAAWGYVVNIECVMDHAPVIRILPVPHHVAPSMMCANAHAPIP